MTLRWGWEALGKVNFRKGWLRQELERLRIAMMSMRIWEGFKGGKGPGRKLVGRWMRMNQILRKCIKIFGEKHKVIQNKLNNNKKNNFTKR